MILEHPIAELGDTLVPLYFGVEARAEDHMLSVFWPAASWAIGIDLNFTFFQGFANAAVVGGVLGEPATVSDGQFLHGIADNGPVDFFVPDLP